MDNVNIYMMPESAPEKPLPLPIRSKRILLPESDSGLAAAMGYAQACGLPFALAFLKTAMWEELSSNPPKRSGSPLFT